MLGPDLFGGTQPPLIVVSLDTMGHGPTEDTRWIGMRLKPHGQPSISAHGNVSRYAPEWSIFESISHLCGDLAAAQLPPNSHTLMVMLRENLAQYTQPF